MHFNCVQMMRKCINNQSNPVVEGHIGKPPFEQPSIAKVGEGRLWVIVCAAVDDLHCKGFIMDGSVPFTQLTLKSIFMRLTLL